MNSLRSQLLIMALLSLPAYAQQDNNAQPGKPIYPPLDSFQEIVTRPLFDEARRPQQTDNAGNTSETAANLREKWRLTGVAWQGDQQLALFSKRQGKDRLRLTTGMYLDGGWQLEEILADTVILTDGEQQLQLELREPRPPLQPEEAPEVVTSQPAEQGKPAKTEDNADHQG